MLEILTLFSIGIVAGLITALPIGPTNLWLAQAALPPKKPRKNILLFVFGLILLDAVFAGLAFWGYSHWLQQSEYALWVGRAAGVGLLLIGAHGLWSASEFTEGSELPAEQNSSCLKDFSFGLLLGSNPAYVAYWLGVAALTNAHASVALGMWRYAIIFIGIIGGDVLWYTIFLAVLGRFAGGVSPRFARRSRVVIGILFLIFGLLLLLQTPEVSV